MLHLDYKTVDLVDQLEGGCDVFEDFRHFLAKSEDELFLFVVRGVAIQFLASLVNLLERVLGDFKSFLELDGFKAQDANRVLHIKLSKHSNNIFLLGL